jgi:hypothetical protein
LCDHGIDRRFPAAHDGLLERLLELLDDRDRLLELLE